MRKLFFALFILVPSIVQANISVSPFYLEFDANSANRSGQVRFTNNSNTERTYNIKMVNYKQNQDGSYSPVDKDSGEKFADYYLEWSPHQVTLKPTESQVIRVQRRGMATADSGEYVSHLMIQEQPSKVYGNYEEKTDNLVINLEALYGVSIPVMIENGDLTASAEIEDTEVIEKSGKPVAVVTVKRKGNRSFYGSLIAKAGKKELGKVNKFRIFTTTPVRRLEIPLESQPKDSIEIVLLDEKTDEVLDSKSL